LDAQLGGDVMARAATMTRNYYKTLGMPEWLPDLPDWNNPGATVATNVIPAANSYRPFPGSTEVSAAMAERVQGAFACTDSDGNTVVFAGTATKLYKFTNADSTWEDVSGTTYATEADGFWSFAKFGTRVIATNFVDNVQVYVLGSSTDFADLGGSPPRAKFVAVAGEQVFLARLSTDPQGVAWSGIDDATTWASSQTTLADSQSLVHETGGHITGIVGGDYVTVYQERAIFRGNFEGAPLIWRFQNVVQNRGCKAPASIIPINKGSFFLADDGFYFFDGARSNEIGKNKVDKTFFTLLDDDYLHRINGTLDPINSLVMWGFPSGATAGTPNRILIYNYSIGRWSQVTGVEYEFLFPDLSKGYTLEQLDAISASLDALPFSLDSRAWTGGNLMLAAFNTDHELVAFTSTYLAATVETAEYELCAPYRCFVSNVRPIVEGTSVTVTCSLGYREVSSASPSYVSAVSVNSFGYAPFRNSSRKHRVRIYVAAAGTWTHIAGCEVEYQPDGMR
jgi:hypothetical protein